MTSMKSILFNVACATEQGHRRLCINAMHIRHLQGHVDVRCTQRLHNDIVVRGHLKCINNNNNVVSECDLAKTVTHLYYLCR